MRRYLLILTALTALMAGAQTADGYQPLVREGVTWVYHTDRMLFTAGHPRVSTIYSLHFDGDTTVESLEGQSFTYAKLHREIVHTQINRENISELNDITTTAYLREDDRKVYTYMPGDDPEGMLLYDFSAPESVNVWGLKENTIPLLTTTEIGGNTCRVFASSDDNGLKNNRIIESVGFVGINGDMVRPNPQAKILLMLKSTGFCCMLNDNGEVILEGPRYPIYENLPLTRCDVNCDNQIDVADVNAVIDASIGRKDAEHADVDGDGVVDVQDINAIINTMTHK